MEITISLESGEYSRGVEFRLRASTEGDWNNGIGHIVEMPPVRAPMAETEHRDMQIDCSKTVGATAGAMVGGRVPWQSLISTYLEKHTPANTEQIFDGLVEDKCLSPQSTSQRKSLLSRFKTCLYNMRDKGYVAQPRAGRNNPWVLVRKPEVPSTNSAEGFAPHEE